MSTAARHSSAELQGRYVFAYRNFRTNQVIYTFDRKIKQRDINAQLPDLGANNKPSQVRPDSWRPFWTVSFPPNPAGYFQGQDLYRQLHTWRARRVIAGERPPDLSRPYTEEEIEKFRTRLEERGGSKRETVWDLIKREKRKMRVKSIMSQKETSIADLAYILMQQKTKGEDIEKRRRDEFRPAELDILWSYGHEYQAKARQVVARLLKQQETLQQIYRNHPGKILTTPQVLKIRGEVQRLKNELVTIAFAANLILQTKAELAQESGSTVGQIPRVAFDQYTVSGFVKPEAAAEDPIKETEDPFKDVPSEVLTQEAVQARLPSWLGTGRPLPAALLASLNPKKRELLAKQWTPGLTTRGIEIKWEEPLDAEYAQEWPAGILHRPMGVVKHLANDPEMPPLMTAEDWSERWAVHKDVAKLKAVEAASAVDGQTAGLDAPVTVRRNADGVLEHIYREARAEQGLVEPKEVESPESSEQESRQARTISPKVFAKVVKQHAQDLEQKRAVVEAIPLDQAPTTTDKRA